MRQLSMLMYYLYTRLNRLSSLFVIVMLNFYFSSLRIFRTLGGTVRRLSSRK